MEYGANILPKEAAYYTLRNASIFGGILRLEPGGSASTNISVDQLARLTENFRVSFVASPPTGSYAPRVKVNISILDADGTYHNDTLFPVQSPNGVYSVELTYTAGAYRSFTFSIEAQDAIVFSLWEMCPEAANESDMQVVIDGVQQSLPRLLFDYNTAPFVVSEQEATIGIIACNLLDATDLQGHFLLTYNASATATLTLRFKDNQSTELFAPVLYDIHPGRGTIGVPHSFLRRVAGYHNFSVTAQISAGTLSVGTRGMLFSIDGGYLAERALEIGANVSDFAIERSANTSEPSYIWVISVESGELLVRKRPYSVQAHGVAFEPVYSLGPALDGAIEFDGEWHLDLAAEDLMFRLTTYEQPFCFVLDNDHNLYVLRGNDESTRVLLDTDVDSMSVCRGFKSEVYIEQDQGVICLYVKNGRAWYVQYIYRSDIASYTWVAPQEITEVSGTVTSVHVHRLNDYRVGFVINTASDNYWLISDRTYVGQSFKPEIVNMRARTFGTFGMLPVGVNPDAIMCDGYLSDDRMKIFFTFNYPVRFLDTDPLQWISMPDALSSIVTAAHVKDGIMTFDLSEPIYAQHNITIRGITAAWQYQFENIWFAFPSDTVITYDPYGRINVQDNPIVNMDVSKFDATIRLRGMEYINNAYSDHVNLDVADVIGTFSVKPIIFGNHSTHDTVALDVSNVTASIVLQLVGDKPI